MSPVLGEDIMIFCYLIPGSFNIYFPNSRQQLDNAGEGGDLAAAAESTFMNLHLEGESDDVDQRRLIGSIVYTDPNGVAVHG